MTTINRTQLKERLIKEGYVKTNGLEHTIDNLLSLKEEAATMLNSWFFNNSIPEFEPIEDIDSKILRQQLKMKDPAIILAYGMLLLDPKTNSLHLKSLLRSRMVYNKKVISPFN